MRRKICVVTGSRAEYGLLRWVMEEIRQSPQLDLQVIVTGMHLSPEFGLTYREIEKDGFQIDRKIEMLMSSDTSIGLSKSMGLGLISFGEAIQVLQPDFLLVLGDRFEIFSAATAAMVSRIPIAHLHGGETTEGAFDEAIRHSITKMSHLHFVAAEEYRKRIIQMGEDPGSVFLVGGLGIDNIKKLKLLEQDELEQLLGFQFWERNLLITFHPITLDGLSSTDQFEELLMALDTLVDTHLIFTLPNADTEGRALSNMVENFVASHPNARAYQSLGQLGYLSCIKYVDGVIGNSSSGLIEVPSFRKGTINMGDRQRGRLKAPNVIDCDVKFESILAALQKLYSADFQEKLKVVNNPYGDGGASKKVVQVLENYPLENILKKSFYNLDIG